MWQTSCASLNALILEIHLAEKYRNTLFQTEDNVVQILFTSVSKATINEQRKSQTIHLHTRQAEEHSTCFLRFRPVLISGLGWDRWSMLGPPHRGPLCMEPIVFQH